MTITANMLKPEFWVSNYSDELFAYAYAKTGNNQLSEDLVQETFYAGLKSMNNFKQQSSERTWLYAILKNKIADHYKKASTRYEVRNVDLPAKNDTFMSSYFNEDGEWQKKSAPKNWKVNFEEAIENKELASVLNGCIGKLPDTQKRLVLLKMVEQETTETVCKELNITSTNYWVIIHRAKLQLRACIEKYWIKA